MIKLRDDQLLMNVLVEMFMDIVGYAFLKEKNFSYLDNVAL